METHKYTLRKRCTTEFDEWRTPWRDIWESFNKKEFLEIL
jgi:hypothetical protein